MSAFLGPVHYWLYRKIQYQEQLNQKILKRICPQLNEIVAQECGTIQDGSLEEIIDHQAIHQWLSMELMIVEKRFAFIVEHIEKVILRKLGKCCSRLAKKFQSMRTIITA